MRIYVINLDRSKERLAHIQQQMEQLGLEFTRVSAIDGRDLDEAQLKALHGGKNSYCPWLLCRTLNELACNLSHLKTLELIANGEDKYGVVLEDDAILSEGSAEFLRDASWISENIAFIKLDKGSKKLLLKRNAIINSKYELYECLSTNYGAVGYLVAKQTAAMLCALLRDTALAVDVLYYSVEFGLARKLPVLQLYPAIVQECPNSCSDIQHLPYHRGKLNKNRLIYMFKRWKSSKFNKYRLLSKKYKWGRIVC